MICSACRRAALRAPRVVTPAPSSLRPLSRCALAAPPMTTTMAAAADTTATATATPSPALPRRRHAAALAPTRPTARAFSSSSPLSSAPASASPPHPDEDPLPSMTPTEASIAALLSSALAPAPFVLVQDVSGGCGSMYAIHVSSARFRGRSLLQQQRMVNAALGDRVKQWHGLQVRTVVPPSADEGAGN